MIGRAVALQAGRAALGVARDAHLRGDLEGGGGAEGRIGLCMLRASPAAELEAFFGCIVTLGAGVRPGVLCRRPGIGRGLGRIAHLELPVLGGRMGQLAQGLGELERRDLPVRSMMGLRERRACATASPCGTSCSRPRSGSPGEPWVRFSDRSRRTRNRRARCPARGTSRTGRHRGSRRSRPSPSPRPRLPWRGTPGRAAISAARSALR